MKNAREERRIIIVTIAVAAIIWIADAASESLFSHHVDFLQSLTSLTDHRFIHRLLLTIALVAFSIVIARMLRRHNRAEEQLTRQNAAIETSLDGISLYGRDGTFVYANQAFAAINGYADAAELTGKPWDLTYDEQELARMRDVVDPALEKSGRWRGELIGRRKNGSRYFQEASLTRLGDGGRVCIIRDITWRKRSEERLRKSERFLNMIFNSIRDPFCIFDSEFRIIRANEAYASLKNKGIDDLIGRKCHEVLAASETVCKGCVVDKSVHSADPCAKEKQVLLADGASIWVEIYTYPILEDDGKVSHVLEYTRDITERKKSETEKRRLIETLERLSRTDSLTGLMNRRALTDSLSYEIDRAKRYGTDLSLILCDIDSFKEINDRYGHDAGDRALQTIAATLKTQLRKPDIAGRHGGDEFMLVLPGTTMAGAHNLSDKLLAAIRDTDLNLPGADRIRLTMSIGISGMETGAADLDTLIKRADAAMYESKQAGRNRITVGKP